VRERHHSMDSRTDLKKKKVLVIDDSDDIRELVARTLSGTEFLVYQASDGRDGIQTAKELKPDLILLDIMMPGFDGFMTGKVIKRNIDTRNIPIIYLSAKKTREDINAAIQAGGSDYIVKPFSPSDLLTRIRRTVRSRKIHEERAVEKTAEKPAGERAGGKDDEAIREIIAKTITRHDDVMVCSRISDALVMETCPIYRNIFTNIVSEGVFKIVVDMNGIERIDGAGLALLTSVNASLRGYKGELRMTFPSAGVINQFSYVKIIDLFRSYSTVEEAVESFGKDEPAYEEAFDTDRLNVCMSCTYVNEPDARYCAFCGTNLMISRGEEILDVLMRVISRRIISEARTEDTKKINKARNINPEECEIPSDFHVEICDGNITIKYRSSRTVRKFYETEKRIGIQAPVMRGKPIPLQPGTKVYLTNPQGGSLSSFETEILSVDAERDILYVRYSDDAKVMHSQKNFSVAPKLPIDIRITNPSFYYTGDAILGKILELSRVRAVVFSEDRLPENVCLSVKFQLPGGCEISSPLVVAKKRREKFMYDLEFVVMDEKERSRIVQYMFRRQIELAKAE